MNQTIINVVAGSFGALITYAFGGWSGLLEIFLLTLTLDYATGLAAALKEKKGLNSQIGFWGLVKKALMVTAVFLGHRIDLAFDIEYVKMGMIFAFLANELISIAENYGRLGLPLSRHIQPIIAILKDKGDPLEQMHRHR